MRIFSGGSTPRPLLAGCALVLVLSAGCAVNSATGDRQLILLSEEQEIELGRESDPKIVASMGLYADQRFQNYVQELGMAQARASERPNLPWAFRILDEQTINAFALPGGFIYVSRGILPYLDSEAELAGVLGHEIGHVTARHSVEKMSRAQLTGVGSSLAGLISPRIESWVGLAMVPVQLADLKFSRGDEHQADELGIRYMGGQGYDPLELADVMAMLAEVSSGGEGGRVPEWLSTHPTPENREEDIRAAAAGTTVTADPPLIGTERYLPYLEGLVFGEDPRQGFFQENRFFHPEMAFEISFPDGWEAKNMKSAVLAMSPGEDAAVMLTLSEESSPSEAMAAFRALEGVQISRASGDPINGVQAATATFIIEEDGTTSPGQVAFFQHRGSLFRVLGFGTQASWSQSANSVDRALQSFRGVTDPAVLNAQPSRIRLVTVPRAAPLEAILEREGALSEADHIRALNRLTGNPTVPAGTVLKIPSGARIPGGE
jgi:predicted Zn-dependent protease